VIAIPEYRLWDFRQRGEPRSLPRFNGESSILRIVVGENGSGAVLRGDRSVEAWRPGDQGNHLAEIQSRLNPATTMALNRPGTRIATGFYNGGVQTSILKNGEWTRDELLTTMGETIIELIFAHNSQYLLGLAQEGDIFVWQLKPNSADGVVIRLD